MTYDEPASYLPHSSPMVLLEKVIEITKETAHCEVSITPDGVLGRFLDAENNLPAWYAIELLAQTVGVWFGWHQRQNKVEQPKVGLLLSSRGLASQMPVFLSGMRLSVSIRLQVENDNIGNFEGKVKHGEDSIVTGSLTTYQPKFAELSALFARANHDNKLS